MLTILQLISEIKASGLRGRGGAGFPSGLKYVSGGGGTAPLPSGNDRLMRGKLYTIVFYELQGLGQGPQASLSRRQRR